MLYIYIYIFYNNVNFQKVTIIETFIIYMFQITSNGLFNQKYMCRFLADVADPVHAPSPTQRVKKRKGPTSPDLDRWIGEPRIYATNINRLTIKLIITQKLHPLIGPSPTFLYVQTTTSHVRKCGTHTC